nr:Chain C, Ccz1 [Thermochaetoides thermophila]
MTTPVSPSPSGIIPAQLGFLAIYNPALGTTDETLEDQIVYYATASTLSQARRRHRRPRRRDRQRAQSVVKDSRPNAAGATGDSEAVAEDKDPVSKEERHERLRQIGLAQGMVEFAKSFSDGEPVDTIDTEKARVILVEVEEGWWILASIDLTRLPLPQIKTPTSSSAPPPAPNLNPLPPEPAYEYSSREVKPPSLLRADLLRAYDLFLLHHGSSLSSLLASQGRAQLVASLTRFWDHFLATWNVLLHGNPACDVFGGIKLAASGELGIGVGEEERGSGEREVLEGLVERVEGLVDVVVGRYGGPPSEKGPEEEQWLGLGGEVGEEDGAVFLGVGALDRKSLRGVVQWMEEVYVWGENAFGKPRRDLSTGHFLLGLSECSEEELTSSQANPKAIFVELKPSYQHPSRKIPPEDPQPLGKVGPELPRDHTARLRPVIYVSQPFIYILLFSEITPSPSTWPTLAESLHAQLSPLQKPLLHSTSYRPERPVVETTSSSGTTTQHQIFDLVYDTETLTLQSTIPNIPDPFPYSATTPTGHSTGQQHHQQSIWTRVEALQTHAQILAILSSGRAIPTDPSSFTHLPWEEGERTCKTARGWWIVWTRVVEHSPPDAVSLHHARDDDDNDDDASCSVLGHLRSVSSSHAAGSTSSSSGSGFGLGAIPGLGGLGGWAADGATRLAQGIGIDTRRYVEGLLTSLGR